MVSFANVKYFPLVILRNMTVQKLDYTLLLLKAIYHVYAVIIVATVHRIIFNDSTFAILERFFTKEEPQNMTAVCVQSTFGMLGYSSSWF